MKVLVQRIIDAIINDLIDVCIYFDNVIVTAHNLEKHNHWVRPLKKASHSDWCLMKKESGGYAFWISNWLL